MFSHPIDERRPSNARRTVKDFRVQQRASARRAQSLLHSGECFHPGGTTWQRSEEEGDLGKSLKVCSIDYQLLERWAVQRGYTLRDCQHCIEYIQVQ